MTAPAPCEPAVYHVAEVYLHKTILMRTGETPAQWPPPGTEQEAKLPLLGRAYGELIAEFAGGRGR